MGMGKEKICWRVLSWVDDDMYLPLALCFVTSFLKAKGGSP